MREKWKGGEGGWGFSLQVTGLLTHVEEPGGMPLVDSRNGFNKLSRMVMLWMVLHHLMAGERF